jgi:hypothetical protein
VNQIYFEDLAKDLRRVDISLPAVAINFDRHAVAKNAGSGNHDLNNAMPTCSLIKDPDTKILIGDVPGEWQSNFAARRAVDLTCEIAQWPLVKVYQGDTLDTLRHEFQCCGTAYAAGGTGNDADFVRDLHKSPPGVARVPVDGYSA